VAAAPDGHEEFVFPSEIYGIDNVSRPSATDDESGVLVMEAIPDTPGIIVPFGVRNQELSAQAPPQVLNGTRAN
jgi:hypothetical protein